MKTATKKKPSHHSYYVKSLQFYKDAKKQFSNKDSRRHYMGLCLFLTHKSTELKLTKTQFRYIQDSIWDGVNKHNPSKLFFTSHRARINHINEMIKKFSAKVDNIK